MADINIGVPFGSSAAASTSTPTFSKTVPANDSGWSGTGPFTYEIPPSEHSFLSISTVTARALSGDEINPAVNVDPGSLLVTFTSPNPIDMQVEIRI